jgi:hypothetical protein
LLENIYSSKKNYRSGYSETLGNRLVTTRFGNLKTGEEKDKLVENFQEAFPKVLWKRKIGFSSYSNSLLW